MPKHALSKSGLLDRDIEAILQGAEVFPEIEQLILFGSRAKGPHKTASDFDLAIKGDGITYQTAIRLESILNEEKPIPYFFDVVNYHTIQEPKLTEHIDRVGVVIFDRNAGKTLAMNKPALTSR
ncbi:MAG: nucleotidyltransferase domain-containing protein [Pseudomonadota bacterium]